MEQSQLYHNCVTYYYEIRFAQKIYILIVWAFTIKFDENESLSICSYTNKITLLVLLLLNYYYTITSKYNYAYRCGIKYLQQ